MNRLSSPSSDHPVSRLSLAAVCASLLFAAPVALAKDTGMAYISSEKDNAITVVDAKTLEVKSTIKTCKRPRDMLISPDKLTLMVVCSDTAKADMIDLATGKSTGQVALGEDPELFALSPDGKTMYVTLEEDGALNVIDLSTKKSIKQVEVGKEPEGVAVSPDGKRIYVTSEVANMVHVVDASTYEIVKNIKVAKRPRRFAFSADGSELWVTNELAASVTVIDTQKLEVTKTVKFKVKGMRDDDISPVGIQRSLDGKTMFVGLGRANHVAWVDTATKETTQLTLAGKRAWGLGLNKDGSRLFVVNGLSDDMTVVDTATGKAIKTLRTGRVPHSVVVDD